MADRGFIITVVAILALAFIASNLQTFKISDKLDPSKSYTGEAVRQSSYGLNFLPGNDTNATHKECRQNMCVVVQGKGKDQCRTNGDCNQSNLTAGPPSLRLRPSTQPLPPGPKVLRVFVTSSNFNGNLGGLSGGDAKCQAAASGNSSLGGTWRAWLSTNTTNASSRIPDAKYVRIDGSKVADNKMDLLDGNIDSPIIITEKGSSKTTHTWTGTLSLGGGAGPNNCNGWTSSASTFKGTNGLSTAANNSWSGTPNSFRFCNEAISLYCFEIRR